MYMRCDVPPIARKNINKIGHALYGAWLYNLYCNCTSARVALPIKSTGLHPGIAVIDLFIKYCCYHPALVRAINKCIRFNERLHKIATPSVFVH